MDNETNESWLFSRRKEEGNYRSFCGKDRVASASLRVRKKNHLQILCVLCGILLTKNKPFPMPKESCVLKNVLIFPLKWSKMHLKIFRTLMPPTFFANYNRVLMPPEMLIFGWIIEIICRLWLFYQLRKKRCDQK